MRTERRRARQAEIEAAAYRVLRRNGYAGTSMLAVAQAARASNETLYRWYGDKHGLFRALVDANAAQTRMELEAAISGDDEPLEVLARVGPVLLGMLLGDAAIELNRAAAAEPSGELGQAIAERGRETVFPLVAALLRREIEAGRIDAPSPEQAAEWYLNLLIGDQQVRRLIGALPPPTPTAVAARATAALAAFRRLCGARG